MTPDQTIEFRVRYTVKPKQGDRSRVGRTKGGRSFVQHYKATEVKANEAALAALFAPYVPEAPLCGAIRMTLVLVSPWRSATSKRDRAKGRTPKDKRPDCDNYAKQACDVLEHSNFLEDDGQIASLIVRTRWGNSPGLWIRLEPDRCEDDEDLESEASDG